MGPGGAIVMMLGGEPAFAARIGAVAVAASDLTRVDPDLLLVPACSFDRYLPAVAAIVVFDAPADPTARIALLDAGAADVVSRGTDPREIAARVRAILRRAAPMQCDDLAVDLAARRAARGGRALALHPREFEVLAHLARRRDRIVTRHALYGAVWQRDFDPGTNVVAVAVSRLRAKVDEGRRRLIHTVAGGYMLSATMPG